MKAARKIHRLGMSPATLATVLCGATLSLPHAVQAQTAVAATPADDVRLEEIVVTASKRSETVKDVPGAITALSGDILVNRAVVDFNDYLPYVPGLAANQNSQTGSYTVILRGLNSGSVQTTPTVGYYLDETPITPNSASSLFGVFAPDPDLGDVERIEVLKGPQATLYGASTLGGLIKIVSKKPDLENFSGNFRGSGVTVTDGGSGYSARASVNVPLIQNTLAARVSLFDREDPGFTDNVLTGDSHINSARVHGARLDLRYDPIDKLDIELSGLIQNLHSVGNTREDLDPQTLRPIYGQGEYSALFNTTTSTQLTLFSLNANYDTGIGTLTNATSFVRYADSFNHVDYTPAYGAFVPIPNTAEQGNGFVPKVRKLTEELRFSSVRMNDFIWQLGLYYTNEKVYYPGGLDIVDSASGALLPPPFNPLFFGSINGSYHEYAAFGDLTYYLTDSLDVTAGTRYSRNQQEGEVFEEGLIIPGGPSDVSRSLNASDQSYLFNLRWRPTEHLSTYLRAASAYRPGGVQVTIATVTNAPQTFGPDTDWNYEVGAKSRWLDGRLNTNVAVYYIDWKNIQLNTIVGGLLFTGNGGNAKSEGVEFDSTYEPLRGLVFGANAAFDQAQMTSTNPTNTAGARVGDPLPYTPKWSGGLTGDYNFPLARNLSGGVGASWFYQGSRYSSFSQDLINTRVTLPSYSLFGLRSHVDWSLYSVALNVDNVANKQTFSNVRFVRLVPGQPVPGDAVPLQPRTIRLTLSAKF